MTEERYSLDHTVVPQPLIREHGVCMEIGVVVDKLNMLSEERNQFQFQYNMEVLKRQSLEKENEQLKEALKNSYINEICENCKYGHYWISEIFGYGLEGDFECLKKHFGNDHWECDGLTECDEFELEIKGGDVE